jgi:hypothetical protein
VTFFQAYVAPNVGWCATAVFTASYFARRESHLRLLQIGGAALWLAYGVVIQAPPVIVANILVLAAALWTTFGRRGVAAGRDVANTTAAAMPHAMEARAAALRR